MIGSSRINFAGLLCSCLGHGVILGGLVYGLLPFARPRPPSESSQPLVVEMLPLESHSERGAKPAALVPDQVASKPGVKALAHTPQAPQTQIQLVLQPETGTGGGTAQPIAAVEAAGTGRAALGAELSDYQRRLNEIIARNSRYPAAARRDHASGVTRLAFRLERDGAVADSWIQESSGSELLDNAALDALERSKPLPPIPASLPAELDFVVEIDSSMSLASR